MVINMKNRALVIVLAVMLCALTLMTVACESKTATLTFEVNGGTAIEAQTVNKGSEFELPVPTKEDGKFEGWYASADLSGEPVTKVTVEADATYYAKWTQLYEVKLELEGGSLTTGKIYLEEGSVIYDAVKELAPTKAGHMFGAWFVGDEELGKNARMTSEGVTLKAKYKVEYKVELYTQKLQGAEYEKVLEDLTFYEYAGTKINIGDIVFPDVMKNFKSVENAGAVSEITLSDNASENLLKSYFDRKQYTVTYDSNYPGEAENSKVSVEVRYGELLTVPSNYEFAGYCLAGWSTSAGGEVVYKANYIGEHLYNKEGETGKADEFSPERNTTLYAVWVKGYRDMFGGSDSLFIFDKESDEIYLLRGGNLFKGSYKKDSSSFAFDVTDKFFIDGKLTSEDTFAYYDTDRKAHSSTLYIVGTGLVKNTLVYFDEYNGITYAVTGADGKIAYSYGSYVVDEEGYYLVTFPETHEQKVGDDKFETVENGPMAGKSVTLIFGTVSGESAFQMRNDNEVDLGTIYFGAINNGSLSYYTSVYQLILSGYGVAYRNAGNDTTESYYYTYDADTKMLTLINSSGATAGVFHIETVGDKSIYVQYNSTFNQTIKGENNSGELALDGLYKGTYTDASGKKLEGTYTMSSSVFENKVIVNFYVGGTVAYKFLISVEETEVPGAEEGTTEKVNVYSFAIRTATYAEYYYMSDIGALYAPMITIDDIETGHATIYYSEKVGSAREFILVTTAKYTVAEDGKYTLVFDKAGEESDYAFYIAVNTEYQTAPAKNTEYFTYDSRKGYVAAEVTSWEAGMSYYTQIKYTDLKSVVLVLDPSALSVPVHYWYSYTDFNGNTMSYGKTYKLGDKELFLINGIAIYRSNGLVSTGSYATDAESGVTTVTFTSGKAYFELNEADKTFIEYQTAPYNAYVLNETWMYSGNEYMSFDGKGGATYVIITPPANEGEEKKVVNYVGTYKDTETVTANNAKIYSFSGTNEAGEKLEFNYIMRTGQTSQGTGYFICKQSEIYKGQYNSQTSGRLELDGFNYVATYTDAEGNVYNGVYYIPSENVIYFTDGKEIVFYFDVKANSEFTVRGSEYKTYIYMDNSMSDGIYFSFDGYGKLTVLRYEIDENGEATPIYIDENGTYVYNDGVYTLVYKNGNETVTLVGKTDKVTYSGTTYNTFVKIHEEAVRTYVNKSDWSVLILGNASNATRFDENGVEESGTYTLITGAKGDDFGLLYYVNDASTYACIYQYWVNGEAIQLNYEERGYYTENLESLVFSKYGFAIFNADTRYYYFINENEDVMIYHQDVEAANKNEYGFVEENFGKFDQKKEYDGDRNGTKELYYRNNGAQITFERGETVAEGAVLPYAIKLDRTYTCAKLIFTPNGEPEFTVRGTIFLEYKDDNGEIQSITQNVNVVRKVDENGVATMYFDVLLANGGIYRMDINITYRGNDDEDNFNRYGVIGETLRIDAISATYIQMNTFYQYFGMTLENTFGNVVITSTYDINGDPVDAALNATFGKSTAITDYNGNLITEIKDADFERAGSFYTVSVEAEDGYTYKFYFLIESASTNSSYQIYAVTRTQTLTNGNYKLNVERIVFTEATSTVGAGNIFGLTLSEKKGGEYEDITAYSAYIVGDKVYYIAREIDAETAKHTSVKYYYITPNEKDSGLGGEEESTKIELYESFSIEVAEMNTVITENKMSFIDIDKATGEVKLINIDGKSVYLVASSKYDEATKTYTVKTMGNTVYTLRLDGEFVVIRTIRNNVYTTADGRSYLDVAQGTNEPVLLCYEGIDYYVDSFEYDAATKTYTIVSGSDRFTVKLNGSVAEITKLA